MASNASQKFDEMARQAQLETPTQMFDNTFKQIGKYTSGLSAEYNGISAPPVKKAAGQPGGFGAFLQKAINIGQQAGSITGQIGATALKFIGNSAVDIYRSTKGAATTLVDVPTYFVRSIQNENKSKELIARSRELSHQYASGEISKENYKKLMVDINKGFEEVSESATQIATSKSVGERNKEIIDTTINVLSLGSLGLAEVGGKQALKMGSKEALDSLLTQSATKLEGIMLKNPAMRSLITRNIEAMAAREAQTVAGQSAWQFVQMNGKKLAIDLLVKRPVFYQSNIGQATSLYKNILEHDVKGALTDFAWLGIQTLNGGPLGAAKDLAGYTKSAATRLAKGKPSVLDEVSRRIGSKDWRQGAEYATSNASDKKKLEALQAIQDSNLFVTKGDVNRAADNILSNYIDTDKLTWDDIVDGAVKHRDAQKLLEDTKKTGILDNLGDAKDRLAVVRWDATIRTSVADIARRTAKPGEYDKDALVAVIHELGDKHGFTNNYSLSQQLDNIIGTSKTANEAADRIQAIEAAVGTGKYLPAVLQKQFKKLGYVLAEPVGGVQNKFIPTEDLTKLISGAIKNPELFDPSAAPQPVLSYLSGRLQKWGISPEDSNGFMSKKLGASLVGHLNGTVAGKTLRLEVQGNRAIGGDIMLYRLQDFIENKPGVYGLKRISAGQSSLVDVRQMTINEIRHALGSTYNGKLKLLDEKSAKEVRSALIKAYSDLPMEVRGLADKVVDKAYQLNPMHKYYSRIQGALRYTYNPFFRVTELVETKSLTHLQSSNLVWLKPSSYSGSRKQWLEEGAQILEKAGIFKGQLPGEAAGDMVYGRITANLTGGQKKDLAGMAYNIAKKQGMELQQLANESPEILDDALRVIVQYPNKGILASPLSRTLNLVFFPMRYNAKVTMLAADVLSKQVPSVQKAVLQSLFTMGDWAKSEEGITWQSQHADAIALFKWITPINSIENTMKILTGSVDSLADMGQLGGLPFGVISQILDSQGIISLNKPYVDPKTGSVFPKNTPTSVKARAAVALTDLLNSTFTYPGRTLGLPGKNQAVKDMVKNFIDTNGSNFESKIEMDRLTPLQQKWVDVLKSKDVTQEQLDELYHSPAPGQFNGHTLPPLDLPFRPTFDASGEYKAPKMSKRLARGKRKKTLAPTVKQPL